MCPTGLGPQLSNERFITSVFVAARPKQAFVLMFKLFSTLLKLAIVTCLFVLLELPSEPIVSASIHFLLDIFSWSQPVPIATGAALAWH